MLRLFLVFGLFTPMALQAADWPQWLGEQRDGVWREEGILEKFPADGPKKVWSTKIGEGYAGPAVVGNKVIVTDRVLGNGLSNPSNGFQNPEVRGQERVLCLDAKTGKELWKHTYPCTYRIQYGSGPRATPTVDGDFVYTLGAMGDLLCLNLEDGKVVWQKNFMKDYNARLPIWGFACHPLVDGNKLICIVGGSEERLVIAYDKKTGKELWNSQSLDQDCGYAPPMIYTFGKTRTLVIWHSRAIVGLDPETGKRYWNQPFTVKAALTAPTPRQLGNQLFVTAFYEGPMMLNIDETKNTIAWRGNGRSERPNGSDILHSIMSTPVIQDGYIYGVGSYGELRCVDAKTGKRIWASMKATRGRLTPEKVASREEPSISQPWMERWSNAFLIPQGDRFFLFNEQGELIIAKLSPKGYEEIDRTVILEPTNKMAGRPVVWMHPAFANKSLYARNDKEIVCVNLAK